MSDHTCPRCDNVVDDVSTHGTKPYRWLGGRQCFTQSDERYFNAPVQLEHLSGYTPPEKMTP